MDTPRPTEPPASAGNEVPTFGIREIDEQHAQLLVCLNRLERWSHKGQGYAATLDALTALNDYVSIHFSYEEDFLRRNAYPKLDEHIAEHRRISAELERLMQRVLADHDIENHLLDLLRGWTVTHIGIEDLEYAEIFGTPHKT